MEFRGHAIDGDLVGVQEQVEVERVELLGSPRADGRRAGDGLGRRIPVDHDLILGHVVAAVAGLWVVGIAEAGLAISGVGIQRGWRCHAARSLPRRGDRPGHADRNDHRQSKITGMIAARTYATRCGRCSGGCCGAATDVCDSCGGGHLGSTLDMRQ